MYFQIEAIAHIHNDFKEKFGIPRQSGLVKNAESVIVFEKDYRADEWLRGIESYSHLWLIWQFSDVSQAAHIGPTVRPPRLGGNKRMGVFATRSPFRPNGLGLSSVRLKRIEKTKDAGTVLIVSGADLKDGTPIFDIKPYLAYTDAHSDAVCGFADNFASYALKVEADALDVLGEGKKAEITEILKNDPRPSYQNDENRVYALVYGEYEIKFKVKEDVLTVTQIIEV